MLMCDFNKVAKHVLLGFLESGNRKMVSCDAHQFQY